mgnify:CR=1 FL=1
MSKPSTRQGLIDYCLRKLGYPVLEINVDDDQIDDLIDDAIQYFQEPVSYTHMTLPTICSV